jgi:hypothetical protein
MLIKLIPENTLAALKEAVPSNLDRYRSGMPFHFEDALDVGRSVDLPVLRTEPDSDAANVISIHQSLKGLPAGIIRDKRFWSHLAHCEFAAYTSARWPLREDDGQAAKRVLSRYFADSDRHIESRNAISRLYWLGFAVGRYHGDYEQAVHALTYQEAVWVNMIERPAMVELRTVFNALTLRLVESYNSDKALFDRDVFREIQKQINLACGSNFIEGMSQESVQRMVDAIIEAEINGKSLQEAA